MKVYVIGSISQEKEILKVAKKREILGDEVRFVKREDAPIRLGDLIQYGYNNIDWADLVLVVIKPDGTIGNGTLYETEYATHVRKPVTYIFKGKEVV